MDHLDQKEKKEKLDCKDPQELVVYPVQKDQRVILVLLAFQETPENKDQAVSKVSLDNQVMTANKETLVLPVTQVLVGILVFKVLQEKRDNLDHLDVKETLAFQV